jgi:outer membrane murein-binding lipoprotein Lpp
MKIWRLVFGGLLLAGMGSAQTSDEVLERMKALEAKVADLQSQVSSLQAALAAVGEPAAPAQAAAAEPMPAMPMPQAGPSIAAVPASSDPTASARLANPAISMIGNFLGSAGNNSVNPSPSMEMTESELGLSAAVDPYARADFFISFGEEGVDLEEGYITFPSVPGQLLVKAGKQRAMFGKLNTLHRHVVPWVDRPLVTANLLGGEEGISDAGVSVSRLLPAPGGLFLEATGQVYRGDSADVFRSSSRGQVSSVAHLRAYRDLSDDANLDVGVSYARGHNDAGDALAAGSGLGPSWVTNLYGIDTTFHWKPLQRSIYHSFVGRSELIWSRRDQPDGLRGAFGYYVSGEYQFARRWFGGVRLDHSERREGGGFSDSGASAILTFWPSEFSQLRAQYRFTDYAEGVQANEVLFQLQYSIGAHGAHPF